MFKFTNPVRVVVIIFPGRPRFNGKMQFWPKALPDLRLASRELLFYSFLVAFNFLSVTFLPPRNLFALDGPYPCSALQNALVYPAKWAI